MEILCPDCCLKPECNTPCTALKRELKKVTAKRWGYLLLPSNSINNMDIEISKGTVSLTEMQNTVTLGVEEWAVIKQCPITPRQKRCVFLYYFRGCSTPRIGSIIGKSFMTVQRDLKEALPVLQGFLKKRIKEDE